MYWSSKQRVFLQLVTVLTLMAFLPCSVNADMFLPPVVAHTQAATETAATPTETPAAAPESEIEPGALATTDTGAPPSEPYPDSVLADQPPADNAARVAQAVSQGSDTITLPAPRLLLAKLDAAKPLPATAPKKSESHKLSVAASLQKMTAEQMQKAKGGGDVVSEIQAAAALADAGDTTNAFLGYLVVLDDYPESEAAVVADSGLQLLYEQIRVSESGMQALKEIEAVVAKAGAVKTLESSYAVLELYCELASREQVEGEPEAATEHWATGMGHAAEAMDRFPEHPLQIAVVKRYYSCADGLGIDALNVAAQRLYDAAEAKTPSMLRWAARGVLAKHLFDRAKEQGRSALLNCDAVAEFEAGQLEGMLASQSTYAWVKGMAELALACSYDDMGGHHEAIAHYERAISLAPDRNEVFHRATFLRACLLADELRNSKPYLVLTAFEEYIDAYPTGSYAALSMLMMGHIYKRYGDYVSALEVYRAVMQTYPDSEAGDAAAIGIDYIVRHHGDELQMSEEAKASSVAQACGPAALKELLALKGINADMADLAREAGTELDGTTMLGLVEAAHRKGVELTGIQADDAEALSPPYIAYVNGNHFILVRDVGMDSALIKDIGRPECRIALSTLKSIWDGKVLVEATAVAQGQPLELSALKGAKGGQAYDNYCPNSKKGHCCDCSCPDGASSSQVPCSPPPPFDPFGIFGGNVPTFAPVDLPPDGPKPPGPGPGPGGGDGDTECSSGDGQGPCDGSGPGPRLVMHSSTNMFRTEQIFDDGDLSFRTRGGLSVRFGRNFSTNMGWLRGGIGDTNTPWGDVIGKGWTHTFNTYLVTSDSTKSNGAPDSILHVRTDGDTRTFGWIGYTGSGDSRIDEYRSGVFPKERQNVIYRHQGTRTFTMKTVKGLEYRFPEQTADSNRYARLDKIRDAAGNEIAFEYNGPNGQGYLTKVVPPSGDGRYLTFTYAYRGTSSKITRAELKSATRTIDTLDYTYDLQTDDLTDIERSNGEDIVYDYAVEAFGGQYVSSRTDHSGTVNYVCEYSSDPSWRVITKLTATAPDGVVTVYERDYASQTYSNECTVTSSYQGNAIRKVRYEMGEYGYYPAQTTYFANPNSSTGSYTVKYFYDQNNLLTMLKHSSFICRRYTYDNENRISTVTDPYGLGVTYVYDSLNRATAVTDAAGITTSYIYDSAGHIATMTHPALGSDGYRFTYDGNGQLITKRDPRGKFAFYEYDSMGNVTRATDALGNVSVMHYDDQNRVVTKVDPLQKYTYFEYMDNGCASCGGAGKLTKVKDHDLNETRWEYNAQGRLTKTINAMGHAVGYSYDAAGRITQTEDPYGSSNTMSMVYDALGRLITKTNYIGQSTVYTYDYLNRLVTTRVEGNLVEARAYDGLRMDKLTSITDGGGKVTNYSYDLYGLGRLTGVADAIRQYVITHDAAGRVTSVGGGSTGGFDPTTYYYHPTTGLATKVYYTSSQTYNDEAVYEYDECAHLTRVNDWMRGALNDNSHWFEYDAVGRVTRYRDFDDDPAAVRKKIDYVYDAAGHVVTMTDYEGNVTSYTYNNTGRLSTVTASGGKVWDYDYNAIGQPTLVTLPNDTTTSYSYDDRDKMTKIEHKDGSTVLESYEYYLDNAGDIMLLAQNDGFWYYEYDALHRLTYAIRGNNGLFNSTIMPSYHYTYGPSGNLITKVEPFYDDFNDGDYSGWTITGTWDASSHAVTKTSSTWGYLYRANTDPNFELRFSYRIDATTTACPVALYLRWNDSSNHVIIDLRQAQATLYQKVAGVQTNLDTTSDTSVTGVTYDMLVRCDGQNISVYRKQSGTDNMFSEYLSTTSCTLTTTSELRFAIPSNQRTTYDNIRIVSDSLSTTSTYAYNAGNELTSHTINSTSGGATTNYTYDDWGRMITKNVQSGAHIATYRYRFGSKLKEISSTCPDETAATSILYDGLGKRRIVYTFTGGYTWYRWDMGYHRLAKYADTDTDWWPEGTVETYVPDLRSAIGELAKINSGTYSYYYGDHLGSIRAIRDQAKACLAKYEFDPYGGAYSIEGQALDYGYTGHTWDDETGLYYAAYRYYNPATARWNMRDPLGMRDGPNLYAYVGDNPIGHRDPLGLSLGSIYWPVIAPWLGPWSECARSVGDASREQIHGFSNDNYKHCVVGCDIARVCGGGALAGLVANLYYEWHTKGAGGDSVEDTLAAMLGGRLGDGLSCDDSEGCRSRCGALFDPNKDPDDGILPEWIP